MTSGGTQLPARAPSSWCLALADSPFPRAEQGSLRVTSGSEPSVGALPVGQGFSPERLCGWAPQFCPLRRSCSIWWLGLRGPKGVCLFLSVSPEKSLEQDLATPILDIEDLVKSGNRHK